MRYEILGPLRVIDAEGATFLSARKMEAVLAALLIRAGQVLSIDEVGREVWGDNTPRRATAGIHVYISQLRKFLHRPGRAGNPIATRPPGYVLHLDEDELDLHQFQEFVRRGRLHERAGRHLEAADAFAGALDLWRGPVLEDLRNGPITDGFGNWAGEARLECVERLMEANLAVGRHREMVGTLVTLTAEHPLRETFYRQLMVALCRSERQGDALRVYQSARETLRAELGLEPGHMLRHVQHAILTADGALLAGHI